MRTPAVRSTAFDAIPPGVFVIKITDRPSDVEAITRRHFDSLVELFMRQGFCAAQSPQSRACNRFAGHDGAEHWAESPQWTIVELWTGGELVDEAVAS
jgi:hypothetical protein